MERENRKWNDKYKIWIEKSIKCASVTSINKSKETK